MLAPIINDDGRTYVPLLTTFWYASSVVLALLLIFVTFKLTDMISHSLEDSLTFGLTVVVWWTKVRREKT
jgi:hypothetical protein